MPVPHHELRAATESAWVQAFGQRTWDEGRALDEVGCNSLEILNVLLKIELALGVEIPANIVSIDMTPRDLIAAVALFAGEPVEARADHDRPIVFFVTDGLSKDETESLRQGLAEWFRFIEIDADRADTDLAERILEADPPGAINVIACGATEAVALRATARLARMGYRAGFTIALASNELCDGPTRNMPPIRERIIEAFVASQHAAD